VKPRTKLTYCYEYPRPAVTVDCVVFGYRAGGLRLLLIQRGVEPFAGQWALPGGFVRMEESLAEAARRELVEETGLNVSYLEQLLAFGAPDRDPRGRVISVAWYALVREEEHAPHGESDAAEAEWFPADQVPALAFDHGSIVDAARRRLRERIRQAPIGFELLPRRFTLSQIQDLYESCLGRPLDKRNFRRKLLAMDLLTETDRYEENVLHRPARLYQFDLERYEAALKHGLHFDL
jgi:8-oxo-dGTP diphosphatase